MNDIKLLPCPFCGGKVEVSEERIDATREVYNFHCHNCDMVTFYDFPNDKEKAIETWNTRKPMEEFKPKCEDCAGCTAWKCDCANIRDMVIDEFAEKIQVEISESIIWDMLVTMDKNGSISDTSDKIVDYVIDTSKKIAEKLKARSDEDAGIYR